MEKADVEIVGAPEEPNESNGVNLRAVNPDDSGEGLPYAPINWPNPGDNWGWKVRKRVGAQGHFVDRFLYPPKRLRSLTPGFRSKLAAERFIQQKFPDADSEAFFSSFTWRIPAKDHSPVNGDIEGVNLPSEEIPQDLVPYSPSDDVSCKAGNKTCSSLTIKPENHNLKTMSCNICCSEPHFCQHCSCILCCKTIDTNYGGYSYLKCEATVEEDQICGHVAHLNCALRAHVAGTVGGSIELDAEYYCRRCDSRRDLISHVIKLLQICESLKSREDIEKILNVGVCILRGSKKTSAKRLLNRVEWCIIKLQCGASPEDIWNVQEDDVAKFMDVGNINEAMESNNEQDSQIGEPSLLPDLTETSDYWDEYQRIDYEIDSVLQTLRKSQEIEYKIAQDRLNGRQRYLNNLLQQLDKERAELARRLPNAANSEILLSNVLDRLEQVKREIVSLKEMAKIGNGFGMTPKSILNRHFGMNVDE